MQALKEEIKLLTPSVREYIKDLEDKSKQLKILELEYEDLQEKYKLLLYKKYCKASEEFKNDQILLFTPEEDEADKNGITVSGGTDERKEIYVKGYERKKSGRRPISPEIPREEVIHDLSDEEKKCACGKTLVKIGEEVCEKLHVIPPRMWVERTVRIKYACGNCEGSGDEDNKAVRTAPVPVSIIPKGIATPDLLSFILVNKYVDHQPFYRQEKSFERIGIHLSRQDMSNWQVKCHDTIKPLLRLLSSEVLKGPLIQMDETTVQVLNEPERENTKKSYMWLIRGGPPENPVFLYFYRKTRASGNVKELLGSYKGYLQTDGYEGYDCALKDLKDIIHVGCFAHARRKFFEASKVSKKAGSAQEALKYITKLYAIEKKLRTLDLERDDFLIKRKEEILPVLERFHQWLIKRSSDALPSSALGKAVFYTLGQWDKLIKYLECEHLTPDNNRAENAIRPFVLGRKNWLFAGSEKGAESSCGIYSLIETAKANNLNPYEYLHYIFKKAPLAETVENWQSMLPWNVTAKELKQSFF